METVELIKKVISEIGIDGLMDAVSRSINSDELQELAVWLDVKYNFNSLIMKLDEPKRQEEILNQLITDLD